MMTLAEMSQEFQALLHSARALREDIDEINPMLHIGVAQTSVLVPMSGIERSDWRSACAIAHEIAGVGEWAAWTADAYVKVQRFDSVDAAMTTPPYGSLGAERAAGVEGVSDAMTVTLLRLDGSIESGFWPYLVERDAIRWGEAECHDMLDGYVRRCLSAALGLRS